MIQSKVHYGTDCHSSESSLFISPLHCEKPVMDVDNALQIIDNYENHSEEEIESALQAIRIKGRRMWAP